MRILLLGASGFIGSALARVLLREGYVVTGLGRDLSYGRHILPGLEWVHGDLRHLRRSEDWASLLDGVDVVINASGALQTGLRDNVGQAQEDAIVAMIAAAEKVGLCHVIQISAAGADRQTGSAFMETKARADAALRASSIGATVLRPGLVIGRNGFGGTELLRAAAGVPLAEARVAGAGAIQCVALDDVADAVLRVLVNPAAWSGQYDLVEREGRALHQVIALHRQWLGFPAPSWRFNLSIALLRPVNLTADALGWLGWRSPLRSNSMAALVYGVRGDADETARLLGREPLSLPNMLDAHGAAGKADRWHARLAGLYPLALAVLVLLWLGSGLLGLARSDVATAELVQGGMDAGLARLFVLGGSVADIAIGLAMLVRPWLSRALTAGLVLALAYIAGAVLVRPDMWFDPLGPMLKTLPVVMLTMACLAMSGER